MKQKLLIIVLVGFISHFIFQILIALLDRWYAGTNQAYDPLEMTWYFGIPNAAVFNLLIILCAILILDGIGRVPSKRLGYTTVILALLGNLVTYTWGRFAVPMLDREWFYDLFSLPGELFIMIFPGIVIFFVCLLGLKYTIAKNS